MVSLEINNSAVSHAVWEIARFLSIQNQSLYWRGSSFLTGALDFRRFDGHRQARISAEFQSGAMARYPGEFPLTHTLVADDRIAREENIPDFDFLVDGQTDIKRLRGPFRDQGVQAWIEPAKTNRRLSVLHFSHGDVMGSVTKICPENDRITPPCTNFSQVSCLVIPGEVPGRLNCEASLATSTLALIGNWRDLWRRPERAKLEAARAVRYLCSLDGPNGSEISVGLTEAEKRFWLIPALALIFYAETARLESGTGQPSQAAIELEAANLAFEVRGHVRSISKSAMWAFEKMEMAKLAAHRWYFNILTKEDRQLLHQCGFVFG